MPGLVPGILAFRPSASKTWMAGPGLAMTSRMMWPMQGAIIASEAKQSRGREEKSWIDSSLRSSQ
jgi:hypothetical protein